MRRKHTSDFQVNGACAFILNGPKVDIIPLFRGAGRGDEFYFQEGFSARGNNPDLFEHVEGIRNNSAFISTSKSLDIGKHFGEINSSGKKIFVYEINQHSNGVDIVKTFSDAIKTGSIDASIARMIN